MCMWVCVCVTKRGKTNKQCSVFCIERQYPSMPLSPSVFVFIPPSISKTWLKCSSYQRLCWATGKKRQWDGKKKIKRKSQKRLLRRDAFHPSQAARRKEHRHSNFFLFPSLPLSLSFSLFLPFSSAAKKPPWYLRTTPPHHKLNSLPRTTFQSTFFQSIDIIPNAPFSPITLCNLSDRRSAVTGTERGVPGLSKVQPSTICYDETSQKICTVFKPYSH